MIHSIRFRLSVSYVLVTVLTAAVVGALTVGGVSQHLRAQEEEALRVQALRVAGDSLQHFIPEARRGALQDFALSSAVMGGYRVRILGWDREVLADSGSQVDARRVALLSGPVGATAPPPGEMQLASGASQEQRPSTRRLSEVLSNEANLSVVRAYLTDRASPPDRAPSVPELGRQAAARFVSGGFSLTVPVGGAHDPLGYVELSSESSVTDTATAATLRAVLFASLGAVLVAAALGVLMGQGMTVGLRILTSAAAEMEKGRLSARAVVRGRDEIWLLSQQFNRMAIQLEASFGELAAERDTARRFVADASHELRTPLTALKTFNELLRNAAASDPKAREEFLEESQLQLERLELITRKLLDLSRLDARLVKPDSSEYDAGELVSGACRLWAESATACGISLRSSLPPEPLILSGDRARMEVVLSNLLSNALKFTPRGGEVRIGVEPSGETQACFWVQDNGRGISEEDLPHIFDRFYRGRGSPGVGSGLGLAIVKSVAELHGGSASVSTRAGHGSTFRVAIPRRLT